MVQRFTASVLGVVLSAALASAQTLTVSGGSILIPGETVQITYEDRARANGSVVVTIDDGEFPNPTVIEVVIQLDGQGRGSTSWAVSSWWCVNFNAPGVREVARGIL